MSNRMLQLARSATPPGTPTLVVNDWPNDGSRPDPAPQLPPGLQLITLSRGGGNQIRRWVHRQGRALRVLAALRRAGIRRGDLHGVYLPVGLWNLTTWAVLRSTLQCPLTVDVVERHDSAQFRHGRLTPYFIRHRWHSFLAARLADRIIAISTALERHYARRGKPVLVVPPQVDCADYGPPAPPPIRDGLRLLYAGTAGAKDPLGVILAGIRRLSPPDRQRVHLTIAGMTRAQATSLSDLEGGAVAEFGDQITFLGRVPRYRILAELGAAHFSVLVRPRGGYAEAGFPSKVPESLAAGCPVILNHTSDLARYITDGREGIVLSGPGPDDVRNGIERALALDDEQWRWMSRRSREGAWKFDYQFRATEVSNFVTGREAVIADR
ncbi:glycosyltransferase involved in cell wall biosynthesis [Micromonospora luteifusca]|uniref:Glycosyltransferase involved in cell wall biosynthesis n=1 Tax=Micromonospora luteifusca TaxID=709860 RepID=A0ABS2LZK3_9ACTN|nr:glycosyltransferase [Micromonospora luteifusca]MBM7493638.1 glycosyltransferase involved in cell wall biosynthesis [Micromonospora luteifusca]